MLWLRWLKPCIVPLFGYWAATTYPDQNPSLC